MFRVNHEYSTLLLSTSCLYDALKQFLIPGANLLTIAALILALGTIGTGSLYTNMLPFTLDQMIGASAEELSAVVQWYYWGFLILQC